MKFFRFVFGLLVSLCVFGVLSAENRIFYPEGMEGLPGDDVIIHLMMETEEQLAGYGFSSTIDTSAFEVTLPDEDAFTWDGTAAESGNLPIRFCSYDPASNAFGGFAAAMDCDPGVSPGEHIAINVHIHIKTSAIPGTYLFEVPNPGNPCGFTNCDGIDLDLNEYDGSFQVLAVLGIEAPDSIIMAEGTSFAAPITAIDIDPAAEVCIWATQLPVNASFDSTCSTGSVTSTFDFDPDYCQAGPYEVVFHAQDEYGRQAQKTVPIVVNNINRTPVMFGGPNQSVIPGDTLYFPVLARDMDYSQCGDDTITITAHNLPSSASFGQDSDTTGLFSWPTTEEDTGTYVVTFVAEDLFGASDSADVQVQVSEWFDSLIVRDVLGCSGHEVEVPIYSVTHDPIYEYRIYLRYDDEILDLVEVDTAGTASGGSPFFEYGTGLLPDGTVVVYMYCQTDSTHPIPEGGNLLANVVFSISEDVPVYETIPLRWPLPDSIFNPPGVQFWYNLVDGEISVLPCFIRADADCDTKVTMPDAIYTLRALYIPESDELQCLDAADSNDDGVIQMADAIYTLRALYVPDAPPPPPPFPGCGADPTPDNLDCLYHPCWRWPPEVY